MIFVCTGTQIYPFDRLLEKVDSLIESKEINDEVFAQIGNSNYIPQNYRYSRYLNSDEFDMYQKNASLIISHGGTGAIINALRKKKNIIAVPRLMKYGEHVDDHQLQITKVLGDMGYLRVVTDMDDLGRCIKEALELPIEEGYQAESNIIPIIINFIDNMEE